MIESQIAGLRECFSRSILTSPSQVLRAWLCPSSKCPRNQFESNSKAIRQFANCEGWWLSGSVAEHWLHKPGVLGSVPGDCRPFHFPLFWPQKTSNLSLFQREARVSKQQQQQFVCSRNLCEWWELGTAYTSVELSSPLGSKLSPRHNNYGTRLFYSTSHSVHGRLTGHAVV